MLEVGTNIAANPVPAITSLSPSSATAGTAAQTLTINGSGFLVTSTITYSGAAHAATFASASQMTIQLSAGDQATAGSYPAVVTNPSPGGGSSSAVNFVVNSPLLTAKLLLERTWRQGRRVLVVIGAGASRVRNVPDMGWMFANLKSKLQVKAATLDGANKKRAEELADWLAALHEGHAPRSIAAMALGTLQRAHRSRISPLNQAYSDVWYDFSKEFVENLRKTAASPSDFHKLAASWAIAGRADLVSLNFDGLTRMALTCNTEKRQGIILGELEEIEGFFLGDETQGSGQPKLRPVVKIWGDVFHAVCTNRRCPEYGVRIPVYALPKSTDLQCDHCCAPQHLQIYFAGYEEKEKSVGKSLEALQRCVAPRIGCILTVGFSGAWDEALVKFLAHLCRDLESEAGWQEVLGAGAGKHAWINVDPAGTPPLHQELLTFKIAPIFYNDRDGAEKFAAQINAEEPAPWRTTGAPFKENLVDDGEWASKLTDEERSLFPQAYEGLAVDTYLGDFALMQQLGIKTKIALAASRLRRKKLGEHNRRLHSYGACHLSVLWFRHLAKSARITTAEEERLATIAMMAVLHHDLGHIPFSHLAEEMLDEVHWTMREGGPRFHHDSAVFASALTEHKGAAVAVAEAIAAKNGCNASELLVWAEGAIEGRSGCTWLDAIVNSPLDCDKLDYVFRDCSFLRQGIHVPLAADGGSVSLDWLRKLFENTHVLPSGIVALEGTAGEQARDFLEERRWLYKHQYLVPGFRMIERLARAVILNWLLYEVPQRLQSQSIRDLQNAFGPIGDTRALKGCAARDLLWIKLRKHKSEPEVLLTLCDELTHGHKAGLPPSSHLCVWAKRCAAIFKSAFKWNPTTGELTLEKHLEKEAGMSISDFFYVPAARLSDIKEIARRLEQLHPMRALVDFSSSPRMLAYPSRRHLSEAGDVIGECFCVSHPDPDRWGHATGSWVPLSKSLFADEDRNRWTRISVLSPYPHDPAVQQTFDHLRNECRRMDVECKEIDPDERWAGGGSAHG